MLSCPRRNDAANLHRQLSWHLGMNPVIQHHELTRLDALQYHDGWHQRTNRGSYTAVVRRGQACLLSNLPCSLLWTDTTVCSELIMTM